LYETWSGFHGVARSAWKAVVPQAATWFNKIWSCTDARTTERAQLIAMKTKIRKTKGKPDPAILADVIKRIVEVAHPEKIVLFGSAARGTMGPDSDLDLLVIKGGKFKRDRVTRDIYRNLSGAIGVDAVVVTPEEVERYRGAHCLVICPALREGKVVYEA
jgi:predicted nucleotidyltransferase